MAGSTLIIFELVLVFGVVVAFCVWELWSLRKDRNKTAEKGGGDRKDENREFC
jgi:hypothetical protein